MIAILMDFHVGNLTDSYVSRLPSMLETLTAVKRYQTFYHLFFVHAVQYLRVPGEHASLAAQKNGSYISGVKFVKIHSYMCLPESMSQSGR